MDLKNNNNNFSNEHVTVLLDKAVDCLLADNYQKNAIYVDGTFGRGGHTNKILSTISNINAIEPSISNIHDGMLIAIDKDLDAIHSANNQNLSDKYKYFRMVHNSFANLKDIMKTYNLPNNSINGILLDLGISSPQIDVAERGFSFMRNGLLDMRMDITKGEPLSDVLLKLSIDELAEIILSYGEEKQAKRIAQAIKQYTKPINDTHTLANIIAGVVRQKSAQHPATRTFQALRIYINRELDDLKAFLNDLSSFLAPNGKIVIISFHSLEDRIVKQALNTWAKPEQNINNLPRHLLALQPAISPTFELLGKFKPSDSEVNNNPRSRSAIMRVARKL